MDWGRTAFISSLTIALAACGGDGGGTSAPPPPAPVVVAPPPAPTPPPPPAQGPASVEREVAPAQTGAGITGSASPHVFINPDPGVAAKNRLFVMLPGTLAVPRTYRLILRTGAPRGFHVLGLTYPNDEAVEGNSLCGASSDPDCAGKVRREIITGEDTSTLVSVNRANSIVGRLTALLQYLQTAFPNEGWGQYLVAGAPDWRRITVAGHSQGGGHAGYLAKLFDLDRVVMFSAPAETGAAPGSVALWTSLPNVTPVDRQFGFTHTADNLAPLANVTASWRAIGLQAFGQPVSVDQAVAPFGNARQLVTSAAPNPNPTGPTASPTHGAPVVDAVTPLTVSGQPAYAPVWIHLAFP